MSTSITVEFQVNDLDANYEVVGTSDNYSFQEKLGLGSDIVFAEGDAFIKVIPLKGNYGIFDVRVFAVTDIGVRSPAVIGRIEVLPKELEDTFTFSEINTNQNLDSSVVYAPTYAGDKLEIDCEFGGKSIEFNWSLIPPNGHPQEGNSLSTELLTDTFLSGFKINLFNDGQIIDLEQAGYSETSLAALSSTLQTDKENVQDIFNNYRDFSLNLNEAVFNDLNLSRNVSLQIVSVDRFGREATGIANATNLEPVISNLSYSTKGSDTSFSWDSTDTDFKDVKIEVLAIPEEVSLTQDDDLQASASYLKSLKQAKPYNDFVGAYYAAGDKVIYNEKIYEAIQAHTRGNNEYPDDDFEIDEQTGEVIEGVANWVLIGDAINFLYFSSNDPDDDLELKNINEDDTLKNVKILDDLKTFSTTQLWGYKYYYTFQPYDEFGDGRIYNLTKKGLIDKNQDDSILEPILVNVKIDNLRFREVKDDLVFNWDVTDQDGNLVDLNQYKFLFGGQDFPSLLGISGSLYDVHTNQKITGITNGFNSKSLDFDEDGDLVVDSNLPSAKVFDQYKYTRELNNSIYKTGGFPSNFGDYNASTNYVSGDNVLSDNKIYTANTQNNEQSPNIQPYYSGWSASQTYYASSSDAFNYRNNIYKTINDFGPNSSNISGLFNEGLVYNIGDIVLSPESDVSVFSESDSYVPGDFVFYSGSIYECLQTIATEENAFPDNADFWSRVDIFNDIACAYFESTANSNSSYPFDVSNNWNKVNPASLAANGQFFEFLIPAYELPVSDWNSQDSYNPGNFVVYENDIWSGTQFSQNQIPSGGSNYWSNQSNSQDIGLYSTYYSRNYQSGDLVYSNNFVYKCTRDDPAGGPITAITNEGQSILSSYEQTNWLPYWELNDQYDNIVFKHIGIPQSGKRSVGIELGIVDKNGKIINQANLLADNPPPYILTEGFNVDSTSEATKVKFNFNYALGFQEKTTKVHLYRSSQPDFEITGSDGLPYDKVSGANNPDSTLVSITLGAEGAAFGDNINQIIDEPRPDQWDEEGVDQITGYYYKILPFDDFGSGVLYNVPDGSMRKVIVYPKRYNNPNPNVMPGRVLRSNPTSTTDAVPGAIQNLAGSTSFENFFLNWNAPGSNFVNTTSTDFENDIDHYEVWQSDEPYIKSGVNENATSPWLEAENTGYRKIKGVAYSVSEGDTTPEESLDPARYIYGAENIFNVAANTPSVEVVHGGKTNDTKYFWVRAVDFAGNKSPFSNAANEVNIKGLELSLEPTAATDVSGFETALTEKFTNTIALNPNNPFSDGGKWVEHDLFYSGVKYDIAQNTIDITSGYIWWQTGNTFYNTGTIHPATLKGNDENYADFNDGDFIVARINDRKVTPAFSVFANALIGTANIENASIINAKINDLSADKITAGQIKGHRIEVFHSGADQSSNYGSIASKDFSGIKDYPTSGFVLSGDGTFAFQQGDAALTFEDDDLILYGKFRQKNKLDFDFVDVDVEPNFFAYQETDNGFEPADDTANPLSIRATFRNSTAKPGDVRFKMEAVGGNQRYDVFGFDDTGANGSYDISGFVYDGDLFTDINGSHIATGSFDVTGFSGIIQYYGQVADSVVLTASCTGISTIQRSATITRIIDGKVGDRGDDVNLEFARSGQGVAYGTLVWEDNVSDITDDGFLWARKLVNEITEGNPFRVDADAIAEVYAYSGTLDTPEAINGSQTSFNFSTNTLDAGNWSNSIPQITQDGEKIYSVVGIASGYHGQNDASVTWIGNHAIIAQRTDGNNGSSVNIEFTKSGLGVSYNSLTWEDNISSIQAEGFLWARKVTTDYLGATTTGGAFRVDADAVAEVYAYSGTLDTPEAINGSQTSFNFSTNTLDAGNWSNSIPQITQDGEKIYSVVGIASGYHGQNDASVTWIGNHAIIAQRTDGDPGNPGLSPTFRGIWDDQTNYIYIPSTQTTDGRGDIVQFTGYNGYQLPNGEDKYYIAKKNSGPNSPNNIQAPWSEVGGQDVFNSTYWQEFGTTFESVATNLLLTEEAIITEKLTMGVGGSATEVPHSGIIVSSDFVGGLFDANQYKNIEDTSLGYEKLYNCAYYDFDFSNNDEVYLAGVELSYSRVLQWNNNSIELTQTEYDSLPATHSFKRRGVYIMHLGKDQFIRKDTDVYETGGFLLGRLSNDRVVFDVGGTGQLGNNSYIRFDSEKGKVEIQGSFINNTILAPNFDINQLQYTDDPFGAFVGGGYNNIIGLDEGGTFNSLGSAIVAGASNINDSRFSFIGAGFSGECRDNFSFIGAGYQNSMPLEEPTDHQGANFIGCGVNNQVNGGSSQSIINGVRNTINGLTGNYPPTIDKDQGLFAKRMLGRYEGNQAYGYVNFSETNYGFTDNYSGVWFPAGIDNPSNQTNIANYYLPNWSTELYVGEINDLINGGWVYNNEFNWCYIVSDVENLLYDQDSAMDYLYVKIRNAEGLMADALSAGKISSLPYKEWFKFYRSSVNESTQKILVEYATDSNYNFTESMYLSYDGGDYVSGSADGSTNWFEFSFTGANPI